MKLTSIAHHMAKVPHTNKTDQHNTLHEKRFPTSVKLRSITQHLAKQFITPVKVTSIIRCMVKSFYTQVKLTIAHHMVIQLPTLIMLTSIICHMVKQLHTLMKMYHISGVMVSLLTSSAVDRGFEPRTGQTNDYKIGICCFSAKHAALKRKCKDWLARNQDIVSVWGDMPIRILLFQWASTKKSKSACWSRRHNHLIEN